MRHVFDLSSSLWWTSITTTWPVGAVFVFFHPPPCAAAPLLHMYRTLSYCLLLLGLMGLGESKNTTSPSLTSPNNKYNQDSFTYYSANIRYSYMDPEADNSLIIRDKIAGRYGLDSAKKPEAGFVIHVYETTGKNHGCTDYVNIIPKHYQRWIALVQRGDCKFQQKVHQALKHNASAVVIYNHVPEDDLIAMLHNETDIVTVFIGFEDGHFLAEIVDKGIPVYLNVTVGMMIQVDQPQAHHSHNIMNTALLLTFLGLLIVGLVVVVLYAVRHARHTARLNMALDERYQAEHCLIPTYSSNGTAEVTLERNVGSGQAQTRDQVDHLLPIYTANGSADISVEANAGV